MLARTCRARLSVRVPRGEAGDVEGGVRDVVEGVDGIARAEVHDLEGIRPAALDLHVDARVTVTFDDEVSAPGARLRKGFGVVDVAVE